MVLGAPPLEVTASVQLRRRKDHPRPFGLQDHHNLVRPRCWHRHVQRTARIPHANPLPGHHDIGVLDRMSRILAPLDRHAFRWLDPHQLHQQFVTEFIKGASDLLGVALIIGIARGVSVIMEEGMIIDTVLFHASNVTSGMNKGLFANMMMLIYSGLSFFIPSSSGMAVLTMPIFAPLADTVGLGREIIVDAYQLGQGLFAFINPTGLILATLAIVNVTYDKWLKFVMPLVGILLVLIIGYLTIMASL